MQELLKASGRPLAAPSANASGLISPTRASHVLASLGGRIPLVIDGGATQRGIESTIVAATGGGLRLLRRGPIHIDAIETYGPAIEAPGQLASHYAPNKPLRLDASEAKDGEFLIGFGPISGDVTLSKAGDPIEAAAHLFDLLHQADAAPQPRIAVASIPGTGIAAARHSLNFCLLARTICAPIRSSEGDTMGYALALSAGLLSTALGAQITSVTDPSAFRPDPGPAQPKAKPAPVKSAPQSTSAVPTPPVTHSETVPTPEATSTSAAAPTLTSAALNLVCGGGGTANKPTVTNVYGSSSASGMVGTTPISMSGSSSGTIMGQRQQDFADQVDVRLFSGDDRIRMPRTMLPLIRGGREGWFKLKSVKVTDRAITASAAVNVLNNPKVHIDRLTGTISINGKAGSYSGQCEAVDPKAQRKF
jgi:hypothetical protein